MIPRLFQVHASLRGEVQDFIGWYGECNYSSSDGNDAYREIRRHRSIVHNVSRWEVKARVEAFCPSLARSLRFREALPTIELRKWDRSV